MVTFNYTEEFYRQAKRLAKRYRSLADDLDTLQRYLMENPESFSWGRQTKNSPWSEK